MIPSVPAFWTSNPGWPMCTNGNGPEGTLGLCALPAVLWAYPAPDQVPVARCWLHGCDHAGVWIGETQT